MRQGSKSNRGSVPVGSEPEVSQEPEASRRAPGIGAGVPTKRRWLSEPKAVIWLALAVAVLVGGGRRLIAWWHAQGNCSIGRPQRHHGGDRSRSRVWQDWGLRAATHFQLGASEQARLAAGSSLARLWLLDQLVAEEEQAVVRRGFTVTWSARRRYPRSLTTEIPIAVTYEVPFLDDSGRRVDPKNLEWSHRVLGARRMTLEEFSPWTPGAGRVAFTIFPGDFETNGPHRLVLQARVRTLALTDSWEIEPPHVPFLFEFDPILKLDAILTLPDATRDELFARSIRLEPAAVAAGENSTYISLGAEWALRDPPRLAVALPLPCDLAHEISIEIEGIVGRLAGGSLVVSGQGPVRQGSPATEAVVRSFNLGPISGLPPHSIERPGPRSMRLWLEAAPDHGWADPAVRSIWPGQLQTDWVDVEIVRRVANGAVLTSVGAVARPTGFALFGAIHPQCKICLADSSLPRQQHGLAQAIQVDLSRTKFARDYPRGDPYTFEQASRIGHALPCDVESRSMGDACADNRQSQRDIDRAVETDRLERDVTLVVVDRHDGVECAREGMIEECVVGKRSGHVDPFPPPQRDRRFDDALFLIAKKTVLTRVRIERGHGDSRRPDGGQGAHGPVGQTDLGEDGLRRQELEDAP